MKILFLGSNDWANISNRVARAINSASGEVVARVCTRLPHRFGYQEDMVISRGSHQELGDWAAKADWIVSTGDGDYDFFFSTLSALRLSSKARLATAHVGSAYRQKHAMYNAIDARFSLRFIGADLYRFAGVDGPPCLATINKAVPYFAPPGPIVDALPPIQSVIISHSPTNRTAKGTAAILSSLSGIAGATVDLIENVAYDECYRRRSSSTIFVDQISPVGGFGASSVEAMASGCVTIANIENVVPEVWNFFPPPPIIAVRNTNEMVVALSDLIRDVPLLESKRSESLAWVKTYASDQAIASYWLGHLAAAS